MNANVFRLIAAFSAAFFSFVAAHGSMHKDCGAYIIIESVANLEFKDPSPGAVVAKSPIVKNNVKKCLIRVNYTNSGDAWEKVSLKFKADADAPVTIAFAGKWVSKDGKMLPLASMYDDVRIDGVQIPNGGFENGLKFWRPERLVPPAKIMGKEAYEGSRCLRTWSQAYIAQDINAVKDKWYELSFVTRPFGAVSEDSDDVPLDISKSANFSTSDIKKFKSRFDLSKLPIGAVKLGGISFNILDASSSGGKNAVLFKSKDAPEGIAKLTFERPDGGNWLYLLHTSFYSGSGPSRNGEITMEGSNGTFVRYPLFRGRDTWLFEDVREKFGNVFPVWSADKKSGLGKIYISKYQIPAGLTDKIEIKSEVNDTVILLGATVSNKDVPTIRTKTFGLSNFTPVDMPDCIYVKEGSALDLSGFFEKESSGDRGRVILSERGTLAFEKTPGKDARFKGFSEHMRSHFRSLPKDARRAEIARYAASFKANGYNFARGTYGAGDLEHVPEPLKEEAMDILDMQLAEFKKNGIYIHHVFYRVPLEDYNFYIRDDVKLRTVFGDPFVRAAWKKCAEDSLNHVNRYTGIALKDDPMLVCVELYNELAICFSRMDENSKFDPKDTILPETKKLVMSKWRAWLKKRYGGDIAALNAAWSGFFGRAVSYKNFDEVECIVYRNPDWEKCCWDHLEEFIGFARKVVRGTGYKGLIVQNNLGTAIYGSGVRSRTTDYVIFDTYFSHPSSFNASSASCGQRSSIDTYADYWRSIATTKIDGRPFGVAEYNHCFWNKYRHEMAAMFAPYSAFQNFSVLTIHESAVAVSPKAPKHVGFFNVFNSPAAKVSELFSVSSFIRGDVKKAKRKILMEVSSDFLKNNPGSVRALNSKQTILALLTGFASKFEGEVPESAENIKPRAPDMTISPVGSSEIIAEAWYHSVVEGGDTEFNIRKFSEILREKKILSKDNKTDVEKGIYQTDTGQITLDNGNLTLSVETPRTEIVALSKKLSGNLKTLRSVSTTVPASVGLVSLDGKKLGKSGRLILAYLTREANLGMKLSPDDIVAAGQGDGPVALENGILKAEIALNPSAKYSVYPLAFNGERREKIPFKFDKDGIMTVSIDNSALKNGSTPFFEIVAE